MTVLAGYYALGIGVDQTGTFVECTTYTRAAVSLSGSALSGLTQTLGIITGPTGPVGGTIYKGAIFDALTSGNCLAYWDWNTPFVKVPANTVSTPISIRLLPNYATAVNLSSVGGANTSGSTIDRGAQFGTINGQPLIAGSKLGIQGGNIVSQEGHVVISIPSPTGSALFQAAGTNIGSIDYAGNLSLAGSMTIGTPSTDISLTTGTITTLTATQGTVTTLLATTGTVTTLGATTGLISGNVSLTGTAGVSLLSASKLTVAGGGIDLLVTVGGTSVASIGTAGNLILKGTVTTSGTPS